MLIDYILKAYDHIMCVLVICNAFKACNHSLMATCKLHRDPFCVIWFGAKTTFILHIRGIKAVFGHYFAIICDY